MNERHVPERRMDGRYLCAELVRLAWFAGMNSCSADAVLEDISVQGACVQMEEPLVPGAVVMLRLGEAPFHCRVYSCSQRDEGYFIRMRFSDETPWSAGVATPQHLTSLRELSIVRMPEQIPELS